MKYRYVCTYMHTKNHIAIQYPESRNTPYLKIHHIDSVSVIKHTLILHDAPNSLTFPIRSTRPSNHAQLQSLTPPYNLSHRHLRTCMIRPTSRSTLLTHRKLTTLTAPTTLVRLSTILPMGLPHKNKPTISFISIPRPRRETRIMRYTIRYHFSLHYT